MGTAMIFYRMTECRIADSEDGLRPGWGIALYRDGVFLRGAEDLSPDREAVEQLVKLFNDEGLDPVHFEQAIEDFLLDFSV